MNAKDDKIERLCVELGKLIAKQQFDFNREAYREEAEEYANDGVTESSYMSDDESVQWYCEEQLVENVFPHAMKEYKRLHAKKYAKEG